MAVLCPECRTQPPAADDPFREREPRVLAYDDLLREQNPLRHATMVLCREENVVVHE
jgi:hypothetical protein